YLSSTPLVLQHPRLSRRLGRVHFREDRPNKGGARSCLQTVAACPKKSAMQQLPTAEEQEWLIKALADLIGNCGSTQFVAMPIVEPTPAFFPDKWSFSVDGLDRVVRRLMQYAGLKLDPVLVTFSTDEETNTVCRTVAGAYFGTKNGCCRFG